MITRLVDMKLLVLLTDAFGGRGGIAKFNRDLLTALCLHSQVVEVIALPRLIVDDTGEGRGKAAYLYCFAAMLLKHREFAGIICAHIHLLPLAVIAARRYRAPV